jgi:hypothetical protein
MAHFWSGQFLQSAVKIAYLLKLVRPIQLEQYDRICDTWQSKSLRNELYPFYIFIGQRDALAGAAARPMTSMAPTR